MVVFHSDHGEAFGEHGIIGYGQYLYEENVHVPLVIGNVEERERIRAPVSLCQMPALIDAIAESGNIDGHEYSDWCVASHATRKTALRERDWKYIRNANSGEFYDLRTDPEERNPLGESSVDGPLDRLAARHRSQMREGQLVARASRAIERARF